MSTATLPARTTPACTTPACTTPACTTPVRPVPAARADEIGSAAATASRAVIVRRRLVALLALVLLVSGVTVALGSSDAGAQLSDPVAGHVVVEPGETLWDVAVASAPEGVDAREQVRAIQELNALDGAQLPAWTVLLLPAR